MQTSDIKQISQDNILIIRQSYLDITKDKHAGIFLSYLEYWHNVKRNMNNKNNFTIKVAEMHGDIIEIDTSSSQFHTLEEISLQTFGLLNAKSILKARKILKKTGFLTEHRNPNPRYQFDQTIFYKLNIKNINKALGKLEQNKEIELNNPKDEMQCDKSTSSIRSFYQMEDDKRVDSNSPLGVIEDDKRGGTIPKTTNKTTNKTNIKKEIHKECDLKIQKEELFKKAWKLYERKGVRLKALKYWMKYDIETMNEIIEKIPIYILSTPEKRFRKNFEGWLNPVHRVWESEIVFESSLTEAQIQYRTNNITNTSEDEFCELYDLLKNSEVLT